jgi:asparagine synthase (glutamine-hydrolysing)
MCGIAGAYGECERSTLLEMAEAISHRGPDFTGFETSIPWLSLAHTRLSIIDLSESSNQPLWDANREACIIFNGEIYNFKALRQDLVNEGVVFNSFGDAEVILNLYLKHGVKALNLLDGIFAFAIWDNKKAELLLARDPFGVKPLYWMQNKDGFYFASEIKALQKVPSFNKDLNYNALLRTLVFLWSPGRETLFSSVYKVEPAQYLIVKDKKIVSQEIYWQYPNYQPENLSESEATDLVFSAVKQSVNAQMVSDVPLGAFLSGGLDSSLVVALASQTNPIQCFTIDAADATDKGNDGFQDDLPYAIQVAKHLNVPLEIIKINPDVINELPKMIYHLDELQADPAPLNVMMICQKAREMGMKVLLSGAGGDDFFSGYRRHYAVGFEKYWQWLPKVARKGLKHIMAALPQDKPLFRRLSKAFLYADLPAEDRLLSYFYWIDPEMAKTLFVPEIAQKIDADPMKFIKNKLSALPYSEPLEKMLFLERTYFLVDHNFNYTDKMSMAYGVEVRVPLVDHGILNVVSKINSNLKQKGRIGKYVLKKAAESLLPKSVIYRKKTGFGAPLRTWLKGDLAPLVKSHLSKEALQKRRVFDPDRVQALLAADEQGKADYSYVIFAILCFEIWCQTFVDR